MFKKTSSTNTDEKAKAGERKPSNVPSVISEDMQVLGNIISHGLLDIDGQIEGNVKCHTATVRPNGRVRGDLQAEEVHVHGQVEGIIKANTVCLYASARVLGTIMHESLSIEDGAFVDGKFKRTDKIFIEYDAQEAIAETPQFDGTIESENPEPESEEELKMLDNLRLIQ
jgi:cytoskeletal protein CcmA (bactofilin family)